MALVEKTSQEDAEPELVDVQLRLDGGAHDMLVDLMQRTGWDASELVGWALGAYWRELEGIVLPPLVEQDIDAVLAESEADIRAGRTVPHEEVMAQARKIVGL